MFKGERFLLVEPIITSIDPLLQTMFKGERFLLVEPIITSIDPLLQTMFKETLSFRQRSKA